MAFNLGISNHPISRLGGLSSVGIYLYEDIYYRQWITEIALAFYEGRQDEFVWLDLVRQFRNPENQQILPVNFTKEIIDETSILFKEDPIYQVVDAKGKASPKDQELWEEVMAHSRYRMFMDKVDRWTRLLGTVLVKVAFVDPKSGQMVQEDEGGQVQLDILHGGVYDLKHGASPYYITELLIGFGNKFGGFAGLNGPDGPTNPQGGGVAQNIPSPSSYGPADIQSKQKVGDPNKMGALNRIYWSPTSHRQIDEDGQEYETQNPYGIIPAVPFFNQDPAHYYFLPINEPLIYANHAVNMRITDLNHIAKFQSFGVPVISGVERPTSLRQGRPVDDYNVLKGGSAQSRFGGIAGISGFGAGGQFRTFDAGLGITRDGNASANALGVSIGPDTAIAVGEKGDFKFAHPNADIKGLVHVIQNMQDMVRINHGLRPKFMQDLPASGFAQMMEKMGVIDENRRRGRLFKEREQQLFQVVKALWNVHNGKQSGNNKFSKDCKLEVTYVEPKFPVDPTTKMDTIMRENAILDSGDTESYKKLFPYLKDADITKLIKKRRKDKMDQAKADAEIDIERARMYEAAGITAIGKNVSISSGTTSSTGSSQLTMESPEPKEPKIDNRAKHSQNSSKQPGKSGDTRK